MYFRRINVRDYKDYEPFEMVQFFDKDFEEQGYFFKDTSVLGFFFLNYKNQLCIRYKNAETMLRVKPGKARRRSITYMERNLLIPKPNSPFDQTLNELNYDQRLAKYLKNFGLQNDSRIIMYSMEGACSHVLSFLMESYRMNHEQFGELNVRYLFFDPDIESTMRTVELYQLENKAYIIADTNRLFLRYFYPAEFGRNPLVRYRTEGNIEVMTYTPQTLYKKYGELMRE